MERTTQRRPWALALARPLGVTLLAAAPALAQQPELVRLRPPEAQEVWVGERLRFQVELLSPTFFRGAPRFSLPEASGLILMVVDDRPVVDSTTVDGETYSRQTHALVAFAARAGVHSVPPIEVGFGLAGVGAAPGSDVTASTEPFSFEARQPPGAEGLVPACRGLTVEESWDPQPAGTARVGDAFRRTVTLRAEDTTAMLLPPLTELEVVGFAVYLSEPEVRDSTERGEFRAERRQTLTFLCNEPGKLRIPALRLAWFDLDAQQLRVVTLAAVELDVAPAAGPAPAPTAPSGQTSASPLAPLRRLAWVAPLVLTALLVALAVRRHRRDPERVAFGALKSACTLEDPAQADAALRAWLGTLPGPRPPPTTTALSRLPGGESVARELLAMQASWVGLGATWSGERLQRALIELRSGLRARRASVAESPRLPARLNPAVRSS